MCRLPELAEANDNAMLTEEKTKQNWNREQLLMIEALHLFAVSFFTGNASFTTEPDSASPESEGAAAAGGGDPQAVQKAPPPPKCPPEQREKVEGAIKAYVAAVGAQ